MSDLRERIAAVIDREVNGLWEPLAVADAVIAELDLENRIASAVQGYAQSEMAAITYHDPLRHRETAYEAMQKLNRDSAAIARYAAKDNDE